MALVQLSDVIIPEVFATLTAVNSPANSAFIQSGVAINGTGAFDALLDGGVVATLPYWKDLDPDAEPNASTDDPDQHAIPNKIDMDSQQARVSEINQGWSSADLTADLLGVDPMQRIRDRTGNYWTAQSNKRIIATMVGVMRSNIADDDGDMVVDRSVATGGTVADANLFARGAFTAAAFTLGDAFGEIRAIGVHSIIMKRMVDNDDVVFIPDSQGNLTIPTYLGRRIIVDDTLPVEKDGDNYIYTSILFGEAAVGFAEGTVKTPEELERDASGGNGGGIETLWQRKKWVVHPFGFSWTGSTAPLAPNLAALSAAAAWKRNVSRKNVPVAFLRTNG